MSERAEKEAMRDSLVNLSLLLELNPKAVTNANAYLKRSFSQIKRALDTNNQRFAGVPPDVIERTTYEMDKQGIDTTKINELALDCQKLFGKKCLTRFDRRLTNNAGSYIDARLDEMAVCSIHDLLCRSNINKTFKYRLVRSLNTKRGSNMPVARVSSYKRLRYNQIIQHYYCYCNREPFKLLARFEYTGFAYWAILSKLLGDCFHFMSTSATSQLKHTIRKNAIRRLESIFGQTLPTHKDQFGDAIRCRIAYLDLEGKVYLDEHQRPIWAMAYYLRRAGRADAARELLLNHHDSRVVSMAQSLEYHKPSDRPLSVPLYYREDLFLSQLSSLANKESICSPKLVSDILDFVWMGLQTCSLYPHGAGYVFTLTELHSFVYEKLRMDPSNKKNIEALFYSMNFAKILEMSNGIVDGEDIAHLALFFEEARLYEFGLMGASNSNAKYIVVSYAKQLASKNLPVAMYYINLIDNCYHEVLIRFLIENDCVEGFFGFNGYQPILESESAPRLHFAGDRETLIKSILEQYGSIKGKYMTCFKIAQRFLKDSIEGFKHLLNFQLNSLLGNWTDSMEAIETTKYLDNFKNSQQYRWVEPNDKLLLTFIEECKFLERAYILKNYEEITRIRMSSSFFPIGYLPSLVDVENLMRILQEKNAVVGFLNYIMLNVQANDLCFSFLKLPKDAYRYNLDNILLNLAHVQNKMDLGDREVASGINQIRAAINSRLSG